MLIQYGKIIAISAKMLVTALTLPKTIPLFILQFELFSRLELLMKSNESFRVPKLNLNSISNNGFQSLIYQNLNSDNYNGNNSESWIEYIDEVSGHPYLYNEVTGESKWITETVPTKESNEGYYRWESHFDENGYLFFYNKVVKTKK
jgi:hypothetical protein